MHQMNSALDSLWTTHWDRIKAYAWAATKKRLAQLGRYASFDQIEQLAADAIAQAYESARARPNAVKILWTSRKPEPRLTVLLVRYRAQRAGFYRYLWTNLSISAPNRTALGRAFDGGYERNIMHSQHLRRHRAYGHPYP